MVYTNFDFTPLLLPESRNTVKEKVPIIIRLPALYSVGVTGFEPATTRPPDAYSNRAELHPVVLFNGCKSTYLRGICKIFRRFFAQKKRFLIGFIYKFLLLSGIVDGCNGIRFPLFALSYF